jgi:hypothetical protein
MAPNNPRKYFSKGVDREDKSGRMTGSNLPKGIPVKNRFSNPLLAFGARGRGFESRHSAQTMQNVAQLVEHVKTRFC